MYALEIDNLYKSYVDLDVVKWVTFHIKEWDFFWLLWPNGAGKTTIIGIICDLVKKNKWTVKIHGHNIDWDILNAKKLLWVVPQEINFDPYVPVREVCEVQAGYYGVPRWVARERTDILLKKLGLWDKKDKYAKFLSGGMKRRLMIARALVHKPKLLLLDEPTAGVDVELRKSMWEFVKELNESGTTILLTTHYLEEAESLCKNIAIINQWNIVENTSTWDLLKKLESETIILDLETILNDIPTSLNEFKPILIEWAKLQIAINKQNTLNILFQILDKEWIKIWSFKNQSSRLEQLFFNLTLKNNK